MPAADPAASAASSRRDLRGSATVWALAWMGVCLTLGWISLVAAAVVAAQHHLDGSADLSALAGAEDAERGHDGCAAARRTASDNAVRLVGCSVSGGDVVVTVEARVALPFGLGGALRSAARAGPDEVS